MGLFTLIAQSTRIYRELVYEYNEQKRKIRWLEDERTTSEREEELEKKLSDEKDKVSEMAVEIDKLKSLVRKQTEADILWAAEQIRERRTTKEPQQVSDPRLPIVQNVPMYGQQGPLAQSLGLITR